MNWEHMNMWDSWVYLLATAVRDADHHYWEVPLMMFLSLLQKVAPQGHIHDEPQDFAVHVLPRAMVRVPG